MINQVESNLNLETIHITGNCTTNSIIFEKAGYNKGVSVTIKNLKVEGNATVQAVVGTELYGNLYAENV